jgi:hypothetical protein
MGPRKAGGRRGHDRSATPAASLQRRVPGYHIFGFKKA